MMAGRNVARAFATALVALIALVAAQQGTALAAAPELTIEQPAAATATNNQTPVFSGKTNDVLDSVTSVFDPVTLDIYAGTSAVGTPVQVWTAFALSVAAEGAWEIVPGAPLEQGEYTAVAVQTNGEALQGSSLPATFTVETKPVVTLTAPGEGAVLKTSTPTLEGGAGSAPWDAPVSVVIHAGTSVAGGVVASATASMSGGSWFYAAPHLNDGVYTAQATQSDEVGDTGTSAPVTFTVDATAPAVSLTTPGEGELLTTSEPTLAGAGATATWDESVVTVTIHEGGSLSGEVVALENVPVIAGTWSFGVSHLSDGIYTAQASQGDQAGHTGRSNAVTFTVDTAAPVVTLTSPAEGAFVKTSVPVLGGEGGATPWDAQRLTVRIHEGGSLAGEVVASSTNVSVKGGTWSYAAPHLLDGAYTAQAEQSDQAGHVGLSSPVTFTVDTTAPALTLEAPAANQVLAVPRPTFSGLAGHAPGDEPSITVKLFKGGSASGSPTQTLSVTPEGAAWTSGAKAPALPNGTYTALAEQSDEAGNRAERTTTFTIHTNSPVVTLETPGFELREKHLLSTATPSFSGSGATESEDAQVVSVKVYSGTAASGTPVRTLEAPLSGSSWNAGPAPALADGIYTAQAEQADENPFAVTGVSAPVTFTVDTAPPLVTLTSPVAGVFLETSTPTLSGGAGAAAWDSGLITVRIHKGSSLAGELITPPASVPLSAETWSYAAPHLPDGVYTAQAEQSDDAGHKGSSAAVSFTVDTISPALTLEAPANEEHLLTSRPTFGGLAGQAPGDHALVTVKLYKGSVVFGSPVQTLSAPSENGIWTTGPIVTELSNGSYTAVAEQSDEAGGRSERVIRFTVAAHPPQVTLTSPANGSTTSSSTQTFSGTAGTEEGDLPGITVQLYAGEAIAGQAVLESVTVPASGGAWSAVLGGLSPGTYTAQAEQSDDLGNTGHSEPVTFTVLAPSVPATVTPSPPTASFKWIPANPQTGEPVTLASTSTAGSSSISGFAWAPAGNGVFTPGESTLTTSFSTPGPHVVQLRVTDADGLSSTVSKTVTVAAAPVPLMQPFPVVRMAGSFGGSGAKITLLTALAPVGANVTITCRGKGCPSKSQAFLATAVAKSKSGTGQVTFRRFERFLRGGVVLEIWISKHGQIGKFTRFVIHRGKSPTRLDECVNSAGTTPMVCPS
jgi:large repetitive protein